MNLKNELVDDHMFDSESQPSQELSCRNNIPIRTYWYTYGLLRLGSENIITISHAGRFDKGWKYECPLLKLEANSRSTRVGIQGANGEWTSVIWSTVSGWIQTRWPTPAGPHERILDASRGPWRQPGISLFALFREAKKREEHKGETGLIHGSTGYLYLIL